MTVQFAGSFNHKTLQESLPADILSLLNQIWNELEAETQPNACNPEKMITKPLSNQRDNKLHVGIYSETGSRFLLLQSKKDIAEKLKYAKRDWFGVKNDPSASFGKMNIILELSESADPNIVYAFIGLSAWVATYVQESPLKERLQAEAFKRGIKNWLQIHDQTIDKPLSEPQQRGLYAEIWFLRKYAAAQLNWKEAINYWVGPCSSDQDFQFALSSVEVKAVADDEEDDKNSQSGQHIKISNEYQLDSVRRNDKGVRSPSDFIHLFLFCLFMREENIESAETLWDIIEDIRHRLTEQPIARHDFEAKLLRTGYRKKHEDIYQLAKRSVIRELFCRVADTQDSRFPRITRSGLIGTTSQIPTQVEKVRYRIPVKDIEEFEVSELDVVEHFR